MRAIAGTAILVVLASLAAVAPSTLARFTAAKATSGTFSTGTIDPPTSLAASVGGSTVTLTWTPTVTTAATGYQVQRSTTSGSGYATIGTVTPRSATSTTNAPGTGTFYYVLQAVYQSWTSGSSNQVSATIGPVSTGLKPCTSTAADTGGNGNGYESNPGNACVVDGAVATDANSGTNTVTTSACTNSGKDRHRFWGFPFGLPAGISSIAGITVQLDAGLNNNGGTSLLCVQLSWDGGASWTTAQQASMSGAAVTQYTFGGSADAWGRTWTTSELGTSAFRVRVIDVTSQPNKDFRLDGVQTTVSYTP